MEVTWSTLTDREKNWLVAEAVKNWNTKWENGLFYVCFPSIDATRWVQCAPYDPINNLGDAIYAVEEAIEGIGIWQVIWNKDKTYTVSIVLDEGKTFVGTDKSFEEALCKAALVYKGVIIHE